MWSERCVASCLSSCNKGAAAACGAAPDQQLCSLRHVRCLVLAWPCRKDFPPGGLLADASCREAERHCSLILRQRGELAEPHSAVQDVCGAALRRGLVCYQIFSALTLLQHDPEPLLLCRNGEESRQYLISLYEAYAAHHSDGYTPATATKDVALIRDSMAGAGAASFR